MNRFFFLFSLLFSFSTLFAQNEVNSFSATLQAGLNMAQLHGDASLGYNRLGLTGGVRASYALSEAFSVGTGILYNNKGSRNNTSETSVLSYQLHYVDVPIDFSYGFWQAEGYNRIELWGGPMIGRFLAGEINVNGFDQGTSNMRNWDFAINLGGRYLISEHFSVELAWSRSLVSVHKVDRLVGDMLSLRLGYRL